MKWSWTALRAAYFHDAPNFGYALPEVFSSPELIEAIGRGQPSNEAKIAVPTEGIAAILGDASLNPDQRVEALQKLALRSIAAGQPDILDEIDRTLANGPSSLATADLRQKIHLYQLLMQQAEVQDQPN